MRCRFSRGHNLSSPIPPPSRPGLDSPGERGDMLVSQVSSYSSIHHFHSLYRCRLRLQYTIQLNLLLVILLLYISETNLKQVAFQHYNTKLELVEQESKMPQGIWTYIRLTAQAILRQITERQTGAQPSKILWHYYAVFARS